jgi:hypothetical protein
MTLTANFVFLLFDFFNFPIKIHTGVFLHISEKNKMQQSGRQDWANFRP